MNVSKLHHRNILKVFLHCLIVWIVVGMAMDNPDPLRELFQNPDDLFQFVVKDEIPGRQNFYCSICTKRFHSRSATRNHVESIHYTGVFKYNCHICAKELVSKSALAYHVTTFHNKPW